MRIILFSFFSRIIESNLHRALSVIVEDSEVIQAYYDKHACLRQKDYVHDLLENVRFLDEQDQEGLHSFLLFQKNHERSPTLNNGLFWQFFVYIFL